MSEERDVTAADLEALVRLYGLVPVPEDLLPRVLNAVREHRAAMRRFYDAGIEVRDVFSSQLFRP